jgi:hypothetical protein
MLLNEGLVSVMTGESDFLYRRKATGLGIEESHVVQVDGFRLEAGFSWFLPFDCPQVDEIPRAGALEVVFGGVGERFILNTKIMVELLVLGLVLFSGRQFLHACTGVGGDDLGEVLVVGTGEKLQEVISMKIGPRRESSFHLGVVAFRLFAGLEFAFDGKCAGFGVALRLGLGLEKTEE